jgi:Predicted acyltransferases
MTRGWFYFFAPPIAHAKVHLGALDSLRGLLALWVAGGHLCMWSGSTFAPVSETFTFLNVSGHAVAFFAALSGMLIYMSLRKVEDATGVRQYLLRRVLRIYPLYFVTTLLSLFVCVEKVTLHRTLAELLMFRTLGYPHYLDPPTWSLYVEVAFYLVIPVLALAFRRRMRLFAAVAVVVLLVGEHNGARELFLWKFFFVGILCAEYLEPARKWLRGGKALGFFALGCALVAFAVFSDVHPHAGWLGFTERQAAVVLGVPLIILGLCTCEVLAKILSFPLLRIAGMASYSLYLIHPFVIMADFRFLFDGKGGWTASVPVTSSLPAMPVFFAVMLPALLFWAAVSYAAIERPFLMLRRK